MGVFCTSFLRKRPTGTGTCNCRGCRGLLEAVGGWDWREWPSVAEFGVSKMARGALPAFLGSFSFHRVVLSVGICRPKAEPGNRQEMTMGAGRTSLTPASAQVISNASQPEPCLRCPESQLRRGKGGANKSLKRAPERSLCVAAEVTFLCVCYAGNTQYIYFQLNVDIVFMTCD